MTLSSVVKTKYAVALAALLGLTIGLALSISAALATHTDVNTNPLPHGTYKIWSPNATTPNFGRDPNMSAADAAGVTGHVATPTDPVTVIIVYENTICSGLPCGVTYLNPVTDFASCFGYSGGIMTGVDVNKTAPVLTAADGTVYAPGDTWLAKTGSFSTTTAPGRPLTVHFRATGAASPTPANRKPIAASNKVSTAVSSPT